MVRVIVIASLVLLQLIIGVPEFMSGSGDYWLRALSYSFFHANWWHLAVNALAAVGIFAPSRKRNTMYLALGYAIAVLVYPLALRPVLGFSNVLYAVLGLRTPSLRSPWWRRTEVIVFLVVTVAMVAVPQLSATTHIAAFALGAVFAAIGRGWNKLSADARRYY